MMKNLILTKETHRLTVDQRIFYETNGYLVIPQLISHDVLEKCTQRFDDIVDGKVDRGMMTVMRDVIDRKSVNKIQDINHDSIFRSYIENKKLLDTVEIFTGPNIIAMHSMLIAKPPDSGLDSSRFFLNLFSENNYDYLLGWFIWNDYFFHSHFIML